MNVRVPAATYRLQVGAAFTLHHVTSLLPYLGALGISDAYLSPILEAPHGSTHGYDVTDPSCVRGEIGGDDAFARLRAAARSAEMGLLLDIVPNHMAASTHNPWWCDLLEFGGDSPAARWFDLSWTSVLPRGWLHLPLLGVETEQAIANGEIRLVAQPDGLRFTYFEHALPLAPSTYARALGLDQRNLYSAIGTLPAPLRSQACGILERLIALPVAARLDEAPDADRRHGAAAARDAFTRLYRETAAFRAWVEDRLSRARRAPVGQAIITDLLEAQPYRLRFWRTAVREITYRRFFDITTLAGLRVEDDHVFELTHALYAQWIAAGDRIGLRVDHVDGLYDPAGYLRRLRAAAPAYTVVEKILAPDETLPRTWQTEGTTGYDFINAVNGWFIHPAGWSRLVAAYEAHTGNARSFPDVAHHLKMLVLQRLFGGEVAALVHELRESELVADAGEDLLAEVLREVTAGLDVYRTYVDARSASQDDGLRVDAAFRRARERRPDLPGALFDDLRAVLRLHDADRTEQWRDAALRFVMRWQQFTGPVMAKGFEDTALYNYVPLVSANEVGSDPGHPHVPTEWLHAWLAGRQRDTPATLSATSTHDTKRSEDVRARLNVLTEMPTSWEHLLRVRAAARPATLREYAELDTATDIILLQSLLGTWPLDGRTDDAYAGRIREYMLKAAREAKQRTSWREPDEPYEAAIGERVDALLGAGGAESERRAVHHLALELAFPGALNSLVQIALKATAPGVPDFYQGTELWCFTLVDPDNRRPVDFTQRASMLRQLEPLLRTPEAAAVAALLRDWQDASIKLYVTASALRHRTAHRALFDEGDYLALDTSGTRAAHTLACARVRADEWSLTAAARWLSGAIPRAGEVPPAAFWDHTRITLPARAPRCWRDVLTGSTIETSGEMELAQVFRVLPAAVLYGMS